MNYTKYKFYIIQKGQKARLGRFRFENRFGNRRFVYLLLIEFLDHVYLLAFFNSKKIISYLADLLSGDMLAVNEAPKKAVPVSRYGFFHVIVIYSL